MYAHPANICVPLGKNEWFITNPVYKTADILEPEIIQYINQKSSVKPDEDILEVLYNHGYMTEEPVSLPEIYRNMPSDAGSSIVFSIIVTYNCNLQCVYCYQRACENLREKKDILDTEKTTFLLDAIDRLKQRFLIFSPSQATFEITGGEPLLPSNSSVLEQLLHGLGNRALVSVTSNGYYLSEFVDLLSEYPITLKVTMDGVPAVHDQRKKTLANTGTYHRIVEGISKAREAGIPVVVKVNVDERNYDNLPSLADLFQTYGWVEDEGVTFGLAKMWTTSLYPVEWTFANYVENMCSYLEKYDLQDVFAFNPLGDHYFEEIISGKEPKTGTYNCRMDRRFSLRPDGSIFCCNRISQNPTGTFYPRFTIDEERMKVLQSRHIKNMPKCMQCKFALICRGGCPAESMERYQSLFHPMCMDYPRILKSYIPYLLRTRLRD